jgi:hypothetical protein
MRCWVGVGGGGGVGSQSTWSSSSDLRQKVYSLQN